MFVQRLAKREISGGSIVRLVPLIALLLLASASMSRAVLVKVKFQAEQVTIAGTPFGLTGANRTEIATGIFVYDTNTADQNPDPGIGEYPQILPRAAFKISLSNGVSVKGSTTAYFEVNDGASGDSFRLIDGPRSIGPQGGVMLRDGTPDPDIELNLAMLADAGAFSSDDLPTRFPLVGLYDGFLDPPHTFVLSDGSSDRVLMQFTSVTPEPGSASLLVLAIGLLVARRKRC